MTKSTWGRRGLFYVITLRSYSVTEGSQDRNSMREPGSKNGIRSHGETLLTGLILTSCKACLLVQHGTTRLGVAVLFRQSSIKKTTPRIFAKAIWKEQFLNRGSSFRITLPCVELTKKPISTKKPKRQEITPLGMSGWVFLGRILSLGLWLNVRLCL